MMINHIPAPKTTSQLFSPALRWTPQTKQTTGCSQTPSCPTSFEHTFSSWRKFAQITLEFMSGSHNCYLLKFIAFSRLRRLGRLPKMGQKNNVCPCCVCIMCPCAGILLCMNPPVREEDMGGLVRVRACSQIPSHLTGIITLAKASSLEPSTTRDQDRPPITVLTSILPSLFPSPCHL